MADPGCKNARMRSQSRPASATAAVRLRRHSASACRIRDDETGRRADGQTSARAERRGREEARTTTTTTTKSTASTRSSRRGKTPTVWPGGRERWLQAGDREALCMCAAVPPCQTPSRRSERSTRRFHRMTTRCSYSECRRSLDAPRCSPNPHDISPVQRSLPASKPEKHRKTPAMPPAERAPAAGARREKSRLLGHGLVWGPVPCEWPRSRIVMFATEPPTFLRPAPNHAALACAWRCRWLWRHAVLVSTSSEGATKRSPFAAPLVEPSIVKSSSMARRRRRSILQLHRPALPPLAPLL
jgi:hypothetical protein